MLLVFKSCGSEAVSHHRSRRLCNCMMRMFLPYLNISAGIPSSPSALLLGSISMACGTSSSVGAFSSSPRTGRLSVEFIPSSEIRFSVLYRSV